MIQPTSHFFSAASDDNSNISAYDYDEFGSIKDYPGDEKTFFDRLPPIEVAVKDICHSTGGC